MGLLASAQELLLGLASMLGVVVRQHHPVALVVEEDALLRGRWCQHDMALVLAGAFP